MAADKQAQRGFIYEKNVAKFLQTQGLVLPSFKPAGSGSKRADLELMVEGKPVNVELKIEAASGGSLVLKWNRQKKWHFDDVSDNPEKQFLADLAEASGALAQVNKKWKGIPAKFANTSAQKDDEKLLAMRWKNAKTKEQKKKVYNSELEKFPEISAELPGSTIADYYKLKDTYYVNVGTNGFYTFDNNDPAGINKKCLKKGIPALPSFADSAKLKYRVRVQDKGGGNFQYTFELSFSVSKANSSKYNIGPCSGAPGPAGVSIIKRLADLDCLL